MEACERGVADRFMNNFLFANLFIAKLGLEKNIRALETLLGILAITGSRDLQKAYDEYLNLLFPIKKKEEQKQLEQGLEMLKKILDKERGPSAS